MNTSLEKMAIVHEIAIDPKFNVEDFQKRDKLYEAVKVNMHKAFWDRLREDLEKEPPEYAGAFSLLKDLKAQITEQLSTGNLTNALSAVDELLNLDHLQS